MTKFQPSPYSERDYKQTLEEALEDLHNNRMQSFRDKIFSLHNTLTEIVVESGIDEPHPWVEEFTSPDLIHLNPTDAMLK